MEFGFFLLTTNECGDGLCVSQFGEVCENLQILVPKRDRIYWSE